MVIRFAIFKRIVVVTIRSSVSCLQIIVFASRRISSGLNCFSRSLLKLVTLTPTLDFSRVSYFGFSRWSSSSIKFSWQRSTCFAAASEVKKARQQREQGVRVVLVDLMCSKFLISFSKVSVLSTGPRTIVCLSFFLNSFNVIYWFETFFYG